MGPAPRMEAANAFIAAARFHHRMEDDERSSRISTPATICAAGARALASDFAYNRHHFEFRYTWTRGKQTVIDDAMAGIITGEAPALRTFQSW